VIVNVNWNTRRLPMLSIFIVLLMSQLYCYRDWLHTASGSWAAAARLMADKQLSVTVEEIIENVCLSRVNYQSCLIKDFKSMKIATLDNSCNFRIFQILQQLWPTDCLQQLQLMFQKSLAMNFNVFILCFIDSLN